MHHELFFALLGHTGDVIEEREDGFFVRKDVLFLSPPQRVMIDRLLQLGHAFALLERFVGSSRQLPSLYVRGLAQGVEAVLHEYTNAIVQLEAKILTSQVVFPIPQMVYELEEYAELLPHLQKLVLQVQAGGSKSASSSASILRGADLLRAVQETTRSGFPRLHARIRALQRYCHITWFKQIISWMVYGDIVDPYNEFFIKKLENDEEMTSSNSDAVASVESQIWQTRYALDTTDVPIYIPCATAESILFIGKSVQILSLSKGFSSEEAHRLIQTFSKVQSTHEFNPAVLEHVVETIRARIASRLYQEIVVKAEFVEQLKLLKSMFLMGRGELFQSLLDQTGSFVMTTKPTHKSEDELHHGIWSQILRDFHLDDNPVVQNFRLEIPLQTFRFPPFPDAGGLVLTNMISADKALEVKDRSLSCGAAWWPHRQVEHLPFTSHIIVDLSSLKTVGWRGGKMALLFSKDASFATPTITTNGASVMLNDRSHASYQIDLQAIEGQANEIAVVSRVVVYKSEKAKNNKEETSTVQVVAIENNRLAIHIQYARVEARDPKTGKVSNERQLTVFVGGIKIHDVPHDLTAILGSGSLSIDHYVGLCVTPGIRINEWRLDKYSSRAHVSTGRLLSESHESLTGRELWNFLTMKCELQWPMHLLVSKSLLRSYSHLFQFSFRLKRVAHALERTWKYRILRGTKDHNTRVIRAAVTLRGRMSFVVRNLEQYFQVFVVESSFLKCLEEIGGAQDFDKVRRLHEQFVAQLVGRFYLHTHTMQSTIDQLLRCCWDFAEYVSYQESLGDGKLLAERVSDLANQFEDKFGLFFRTVRNPNMRDLLLLLDFNEFLSRGHSQPTTQLDPAGSVNDTNTSAWHRSSNNQSMDFPIAARSRAEDFL